MIFNPSNSVTVFVKYTSLDMLESTGCLPRAVCVSKDLVVRYNHFQVVGVLFHADKIFHVCEDSLHETVVIGEALKLGSGNFCHKLFVFRCIMSLDPSVASSGVYVMHGTVLTIVNLMMPYLANRPLTSGPCFSLMYL